MSQQNEIKVKRIGNHNFDMPAYQTKGAACFDLIVASKIDEEDHVIRYGCGFAFQIPENHVMIVNIRSSIGNNKMVTLTNNTGIIDSDYRGEVQIKLLFPEWQEWRPTLGERVAQAMVIPCNQFKMIEVDELDSTERGHGGHGSTGTH